MKAKNNKYYLSIALITLLVFSVNAQAALVIDGVRIVFDLSTQNDINNATSIVEITVTQSGVTQKIIPVVGQQYEFVLKEGDSFRQDMMAFASSGATPQDAGTNSLTGGFSIRAIYEDTRTNPLAGFASPTAAAVLILRGEANSDGINAVSQANLNTSPFDPEIPLEFLLARSATRGSGLEDNKNFRPLGTFGDEVNSFSEIDFLLDALSNNEQESEVVVANVFSTISNTATSSTSNTMSSISFEIAAPVPLPAAAWLFMSGLIGLVWKGCKARQSIAA